jgi:hypothetical protein
MNEAGNLGMNVSLFFVIMILCIQIIIIIINIYFGGAIYKQLNISAEISLQSVSRDQALSLQSSFLPRKHDYPVSENPAVQRAKRIGRFLFAMALFGFIALLYFSLLLFQLYQRPTRMNNLTELSVETSPASFLLRRLLSIAIISFLHVLQYFFYKIPSSK